MHGSRMQIMGLCPSPVKSSTHFHRVFDLSLGLMVLSCQKLDFISFPSAQRAGCLLHPPLLRQVGILGELCVVLASSWSTLAPGEIKVSKVKRVCM